MEKTVHRFALKPLLIIMVGINILSCGFHLRGNYPSSTAIHTIHLVTTQPYASFTRLFKNKLRESHITLAPESAPAQLTVNLTKTYLHYPPAGNYYGVESRIYTFTYIVEYKVTRHAPRPITQHGSLSVVRTITIKRNEAIGSTAQLPIITQEMQMEAAERLLSRLKGFAAHSLLNAQPSLKDNKPS